MLLLAEVASAHISSSGFLVVHVQGETLSGSLEIAIRDAEMASESTRITTVKSPGASCAPPSPGSRGMSHNTSLSSAQGSAVP